MGTKKNLVMLLGIAFVVAIVATGLFYGLVVGKLNATAEARHDVVVVAAKDLRAGTVLAPADVKLVSRTSVDALVDGFGDPAAVAGLVVMQDTASGEPLGRESLVSKQSSHGAAMGVPPGYRAVSIHVTDSTGVVRMLHKGHHVDAQVMYDTNTSTGQATRLRTVLQDLEVLRVESEPESSEGRPVLPVVTLLARPVEADALGLADAAARIRLVLRHPLDRELTEREPMAIAALVKNPPKQAADRQGNAMQSRSGPAGDEPVQSAAVREVH